MKKVRYVAFDGPDGLGKTTQLDLLAKKLKADGRALHSTRLLGGDGTDDFQLACRKVLLHAKFPKDSLEFEEQMFAMTDLEGIKAAQSALHSNPELVALKDRALGSHVAYALAKGMPLAQVEQVHRNVILAEKDIARRFGAVHLVFIPDQIDWLLERVVERNKKSGVEIVDRLENKEVQTKVVEALRQLPFMRSMNDINIEHVMVNKTDTIQEVQNKVNTVLSKYQF
jgi:thymidylate kinase